MNDRVLMPMRVDHWETMGPGMWNFRSFKAKMIYWDIKIFTDPSIQISNRLYWNQLIREIEMFSLWFGVNWCVCEVIEPWCDRWRGLSDKKIRNWQRSYSLPPYYVSSAWHYLCVKFFLDLIWSLPLKRTISLALFFTVDFSGKFKDGEITSSVLQPLTFFWMAMDGAYIFVWESTCLYKLPSSKEAQKYNHYIAEFTSAISVVCVSGIVELII